MLNDYDGTVLRLFNNELNVEPCRLVLSKADPVPALEKLRKKQFLTPVLRTACERPRIPGLLENMLAMIKRNFNSPELCGEIDIESLSCKVVDSFVSSYISSDFLSVFNSYRENKADCYISSHENFSDWLAKQTPDTVGQLANYDFVGIPSVNEYKHMIKTQPKLKSDTSIQNEYPALQTIVYHSKKINAIFGPIFKELTRRLLNCIDGRRFMIYTRKKPEEIQEFFSTITDLTPKDILELDISKYDKSQGEFHFAVEMKIWESLGLDSYLSSLWACGHKRTVLKDYIAGIKTVLYYQRKSGDVTTFIGNTVIIAACVADLLPMNKCLKAAFCGDDSLVLMEKGGDYSMIQQEANLVWNFEAKLFIKKRHAYFCGKYVVFHDNGCVVFPDPLKLVGKLGIKALTSWEHCEEFRTSLCDVAKPFSSCEYFSLLDEAIQESFPNAGGGCFVYRALWRYLTNPHLFRTLFVS